MRMRFFAALVLAFTCYADSLEVRQRVLTRLGQEADLFERSAHRVIGIETLLQTRAAGVEISRRNIETRVPERKREIVSEYGYVAVDERGGSLKESRSVLTIDGLKWNKPKGLDNLAKTISAKDDKQKRKLLEEFESYGLHGVISDVSQLILLFARGRAAQYEFAFESEGRDPSGEDVVVYRFAQIDGPQSFRVFQGKQVVGDKIHGKLWARAGDGEPLRIALETLRSVKSSQLRDTVLVSYFRSDFGFLLPVRVLHEQFEDGALTVSDDFLYSGFKEVIPAVKPR